MAFHRRVRLNRPEEATALHAVGYGESPATHYPNSRCPCHPTPAYRLLGGDGLVVFVHHPPEATVIIRRVR
jgi:hypothetical protein